MNEELKTIYYYFIGGNKIRKYTNVYGEYIAGVNEGMDFKVGLMKDWNNCLTGYYRIIRPNTISKF